VGGVLLAGAMGVTGYYGLRYFGQVMKSIPVLTAADFEIGQSGPSWEHDALVAACTRRKRSEKQCACLASKAEAELTRFDRLFLTATWEMSIGKLTALGAAAGIVRKDANAVINSAEKRINATAATCGLSM
jgi:hypothetical protein